jgi:hypothetical protein
MDKVSTSGRLIAFLFCGDARLILFTDIIEGFQPQCAAALPASVRWQVIQKYICVNQAVRFRRELVNIHNILRPR